MIHDIRNSSHTVRKTNSKPKEFKPIISLMRKKSTALLTCLSIVLLNIQVLAQIKPNVEEVLDSLEVLKQVGGLVDGYSNPPTEEETRYYKITGMLYALPFEETTKLMSDPNKLVQVYGFRLLTKLWFDSITTADLRILEDSTLLPIHTRYGVRDVGLTVGRYCKMVYLSTIEERERQNKETDVRLAVKQFILDNALYDDSYSPKEFLNYSVSSIGSRNIYVIQHSYTLKNNKGKKVETTHYFILDSQIKVNMIEQTRSTTISSDPPRTEDWLALFGSKQEVSDQQAIIQMSIDFDQLQQYYDVDENEERKPLVIHDDGIVSNKLILKKFGEPVVFMTKEEMFFHNISACLDFDTFEFTSKTAEVVFRYDVEGVRVSLTFEKLGDTWVITTKKLIEK